MQWLMFSGTVAHLLASLPAGCACQWEHCENNAYHHHKLVLLSDIGSPPGLIISNDHSVNMLPLFWQEQWQIMPLPSPWRPSSNAVVTFQRTWLRSEATISTRASISRQWWSLISPRASRPAGWAWPSRRSTIWWKNIYLLGCLLKNTFFQLLVMEFSSTTYTLKLGSVDSTLTDREAPWASWKEWWRRNGAWLHHLPGLHLQPHQLRDQREHPLSGRAQNGTCLSCLQHRLHL